MIEWNSKWNQFNSYKALVHVPYWEQIIKQRNIPPPIFVSVDLSNRCNFNCYMCNAKSILESSTSQMSLDYMIELADFLQKWDVNSWASIFQPFPKTAIFDYCLEKNLIKENISCYSYHDRSPLFIPKKQELIRLHKLWFFFVKYQVPTDLVKILITQPMTKKIQNEIWKLRLDVSKHLLYNL